MTRTVEGDRVENTTISIFSRRPPRGSGPLLGLRRIVLAPRVNSGAIRYVSQVTLSMTRSIRLILSKRGPGRPVGE